MHEPVWFIFFQGSFHSLIPTHGDRQILPQEGGGKGAARNINTNTYNSLGCNRLKLCREQKKESLLSLKCPCKPMHIYLLLASFTVSNGAYLILTLSTLTIRSLSHETSDHQESGTSGHIFWTKRTCHSSNCRVYMLTYIYKKLGLI